MSFILLENQIEKITNHFGNEFYEKVVKDIDRYSKEWELEILEFVEYYSANLILICHSRQYGDAVLKIGRNSEAFFTETQFLEEYKGNGFCKVFKSDIENGVILEEYIKPGTRLRDEEVLEKRLSVFVDLYNGLHIKPARDEIYPTYLGWVSRITEYMSKRDDYKELYDLMKEAEEVCLDLCKQYPEKVLLHGDFHHDNILLGKDNKYKIIDPKGVIGASIFDVPRFILNEFEVDISFEHYSKHMRRINDFFVDNLNIPIDVIKKCVFIETAMANCWMVEDNEVPDIGSVIYAKVLMD